MSVSSLIVTTATTTTNSPIGTIEGPHYNGHVSQNGVGNGGVSSLKLRNPADLQIKLEKQLQKSRQVKAQITHYSAKDLYTGNNKYSAEEQTPLVSLDNSGDEFEDVSLKQNHQDEEDEDVVIFKQPKTQKYRYSSAGDCTEQLLKDGFRLDELSDDEDLDLIPPKSDGATWCSCEQITPSCSIQ